jgi:hypothetical protein
MYEVYYIYPPPYHGNQKKSEDFWAFLSPTQPPYTALTGPETAICERPRAGDQKSGGYRRIRHPQHGASGQNRKIAGTGP